MTITASLTVTEVAADHLRYTLDCRHATTTLDHIIPSDGAIDEAVLLDLLRLRHAETCACGYYVAERGEA